MSNQRGYIIPLVLMLTSMAVLMVTVIYWRGSVYVPFMSAMLKQQKARQLAMSGVQVAMSQLAVVPEQKENKKMTPVDNDKAFLTEILPTLNRWQQFVLKKDADGIDGEIRICIGCEDGKIDLNAIFDFEKKQFNGNWKKIIELMFARLKSEMNIETNLFEPFEKLLKERQYRFNDATELLTLEQFQVFAGKVFYVPPTKDEKGKRPVYLMDLFTTYGSTDKLQPWLFSDSVCAVLGIKRATSEVKQRKEMIKNWIQHFSAETNWQLKWNELLKPVYGIELQSLPNGIDSVLDNKFDPKMFCVVSYGKVGDVVQRAYAMVERIVRNEKDSVSYDCKIKKFYWI
jgi:hypothetical protein